MSQYLWPRLVYCCPLILHGVSILSILFDPSGQSNMTTDQNTACSLLGFHLQDHHVARPRAFPMCSQSIPNKWYAKNWPKHNEKSKKIMDQSQHFLVGLCKNIAVKINRTWSIPVLCGSIWGYSMSSSVFPDILVVQFLDSPDIVLNFGFRVIFFDLARNETILLENFKCRRVFVDITSAIDILIT